MSETKRPFLTARWLNLLLVTWKVPDALLISRVPQGLDLDRYDGSALVSLVAFDFVDTRIGRVRWPGLTNFPELNLRFYVRGADRRGVCFIREYVPNLILASVARLLYNAPYRSARYRREGTSHVIHWGGRQHRIGWSVSGNLATPEPTSTAHFLKEHSWGFGRTRKGKTLFYRVDHPTWRTWPEVKIDIDFNPAVLYGQEWALLASLTPWSVIAAEGSEVAVYPPVESPLPIRLD